MIRGRLVAAFLTTAVYCGCIKSRASNVNNLLSVFRTRRSPTSLQRAARKNTAAAWPPTCTTAASSRRRTIATSEGNCACKMRSVCPPMPRGCRAWTSHRVAAVAHARRHRLRLARSIAWRRTTTASTTPTMSWHAASRCSPSRHTPSTASSSMATPPLRTAGRCSSGLHGSRARCASV